MSDDPFLELISTELVSLHGVHTVFLYGSRADGSANGDSDYDIAAFGPIPEPLRIARQEQAGYLDVWVYPEGQLAEAKTEFLRLKGSKVLLQRGNAADTVLEKIEALYRGGPARLTTNEIEARTVWAQKMLVRIERADPEGHYRRMLLLHTLLEDYFQRRALWFEGPKKALRCLEASDRRAYLAYCRAIEPGASTQTIATLVQVFTGGSDASTDVHAG
jgi:predicted nucleotidyltransferase